MSHIVANTAHNLSRIVGNAAHGEFGLPKQSERKRLRLRRSVGLADKRGVWAACGRPEHRAAGLRCAQPQPTSKRALYISLCIAIHSIVKHDY